MKHIPGPWAKYGNARKNDFGVWQCKVLERFAPVAMIVANGYAQNEAQAEANAKLIAAAPELLEALENLIKWGHGTVNHIRAIKDAEAAIKKATI